MQGRQSSVLLRIAQNYTRPAKCSLAYCSHAYLTVNMTCFPKGIEGANLCRLSNFRTNHLPLVRLVLFNGIQKGLALGTGQSPQGRVVTI
jgi:hypothetical protein